MSSKFFSISVSPVMGSQVCYQLSYVGARNQTQVLVFLKRALYWQSHHSSPVFWSLIWMTLWICCSEFLSSLNSILIFVRWTVGKAFSLSVDVCLFRWLFPLLCDFDQMMQLHLVTLLTAPWSVLNCFSLFSTSTFQVWSLIFRSLICLELIWG